MTDFYFIKKLEGFVPSDSNTQEKVRKYKLGSILRCGNIKVPRNPKFHRKGMALLHLAFENQEEYQNFEDFYNVMKIRVGYVDYIKYLDKTLAIPKSFAFDKMDNLSFEKVYNDLRAVILEDVMEGVDAGSMDREVLNRVREFMDAN